VFAFPTDDLDFNHIGPATGNDVCWALQWNFNIKGSSSLGISEDNLLSGVAVPEPSAFALLSLSLGLLAYSKLKR
jgi:hypothetical protein